MMSKLNMEIVCSMKKKKIFMEKRLILEMNLKYKELGW